MIGFLKRLFAKKPRWNYIQKTVFYSYWECEHDGMIARIESLPSGFRLFMTYQKFRKGYMYHDLKTAKKEGIKKLLAQEL